MCDNERIRLVILGGQGVGKSCILKRFLFNTYTDRYRSTVEDLYNRDFHVGAVTIKVDMLDTCGDLQFPAMRRLSIATAHAFLLVYSTTCLESFHSVKCYFEEIREQRQDFQEIPIVVAGNKSDMTSHHRAVHLEDVSEWLYCELPKLRTKLLECSAKDNYNIKEVFRTFLTLSQILTTNGDENSLKRRSSAYVNKGMRRSASPCPSTTDSSSNVSTKSLSDMNTPGIASTSAPAKPRSRSLIRRCSRKTKQQIRDSAQGGVDECNVS